MFLLHFHRDPSSKCAAREGEKHQTSTYVTYRARLMWGGSNRILSRCTAQRGRVASALCRSQSVKSFLRLSGILRLLAGQDEKNNVPRLLGRSRQYCVVYFLTIRLVCAPFHFHTLKSCMKNSVTHIKSRTWLLKHLCFCSLEPSKRWRKRAIFILRMREHIHIHSFPISVACEQISIFQPQTIQNIYVQSQAFKHSSLCGRQILTVLQRLIWTFFPLLSAFNTLQSKYWKAARWQEWKFKKSGGKYNLLMTPCLCWHAILLDPVKDLLHQQAHFISLSVHNPCS